MRYLTYILLGIGGLIAIAALSVVFLRDDEPATVVPQRDTNIEIITDDTSDAELNEKAKNADNQTSQTTKTDQPAIARDFDQDRSQLAIDLAQVKPNGQAVFAGQSAPGAKITVFEGDILLGQTVADDNGEWVVILEKTLAPGQHLVSVAMETTAGETQLSNATLAIEIAVNQNEQPLVAVLPQTEYEVPKLLQSPDDKQLETATVATVEIEDSAKTNVDREGVVSQAQTNAAETIDPTIVPRAIVWRANNELAISGMARQGVRVTVRVDDKIFGEAIVIANGNWTVFGAIDRSLPRVDFRFSLHDKLGDKVARYDLPVTVRDLDVGLDGSEMVVINRGDALWRIAYRSYGEGVRYVDIVRRNAGAIADPDLIFPNQIFALPKL